MSLRNCKLWSVIKKYLMINQEVGQLFLKILKRFKSSPLDMKTYIISSLKEFIKPPQFNDTIHHGNNSKKQQVF